jgi:hypothetical protein
MPNSRLTCDSPTVKQAPPSSRTREWRISEVLLINVLSGNSLRCWEYQTWQDCLRSVTELRKCTRHTLTDSVFGRRMTREGRDIKVLNLPGLGSAARNRTVFRPPGGLICSSHLVSFSVIGSRIHEPTPSALISSAIYVIQQR